MLSLEKVDHQNIWHPFTQYEVWKTYDPLIIEKGEGCELIDIYGNRFIDGISSLWCNVHGHSMPQILESMHKQIDKICHSTLLGISHVPIIELTKRLIKIMPQNLSRIFYADSGSTAVEAALRMAIEMRQKQNTTASKKKKEILSLENAYHGDTLGAVGVAYDETFHSSLHHFVHHGIKTPPPHIFRFYKDFSSEDALAKSISELKNILQARSDQISAMIIEPLVQGAAGIWTHEKEFLAEACTLCKKHDVLFIADEVATGFGKTGKMFAVEHAGIIPDILILGKGLSAGYLPISAAVATEEVFLAFCGQTNEHKTFYYGQTFAGNPLAAATACANLDLFETTKLLEKLPQKIEYFHQLLDSHILPLPNVCEVRKSGFMIGIELTKSAGEKVPFAPNELAGHRIVLEARRRGLIIRPLGNVIVLMPALAIEENALEKIVKITAEAIDKVLT